MLSSTLFRTCFKSSGAGPEVTGFQLTLHSLTELSAENSEGSSQSTISENIEEEETVEELEEGRQAFKEQPCKKSVESILQITNLHFAVSLMR